MSCVDFCYMEYSVVLCWLALTHCFFSENDVEKKFCPGLGMELWEILVFQMLYVIIQILEGLNSSSF